MLPIPRGNRTDGYGLTIKSVRTMSFKYDGKEYLVLGASKHEYGGICPSNYRSFFEKQLDRFLLDYLKANPKKENK
jgi:hypothetical protein